MIVQMSLLLFIKNTEWLLLVDLNLINQTTHTHHLYFCISDSFSEYTKTGSPTIVSNVFRNREKCIWSFHYLSKQVNLILFSDLGVFFFFLELWTVEISID